MSSLGIGIGIHLPVRSGVRGGSLYDPDALDYFNRAEALDPNAFDLDGFVSGLYPDVVKGYWNTFVTSLKVDGTWDQIDELCPLSGVTFGAITAKLKHSGNSTTTLVNFVSGDHVPAGTLPGLKGSNDAAGKRINSNWSPSNTITIPSGHHSVFTTEPIVLGGSNFAVEGASDGVGNESMSFFLPFVDGTIYSDFFSSSGGRVSAIEPTTGLILANATASAHRLLHDGSLFASGSSPTGIVPTMDYYFFSNGGISGYNAARQSIRTMGQGLTSGQETTLNNAIQALMASLGYA